MLGAIHPSDKVLNGDTGHKARNIVAKLSRFFETDPPDNFLFKLTWLEDGIFSRFTQT